MLSKIGNFFNAMNPLPDFEKVNLFEGLDIYDFSDKKEEVETLTVQETSFTETIESPTSRAQQKTIEISKSWYQEKLDTAKNAFSALGDGLLYIAESPIVQAMGSFAGGALPIDDKGAKVLSEHTQQLTHAVNEQAHKACHGETAQKIVIYAKEKLNACTEAAGDLASKALDTEAGDVVIDMATFVAVYAANAAIEGGAGKILARAAKYFISSTKEITEKTEKAVLELDQLTGGNRLSKLLEALAPTTINFVDKHARENLSPKKLKLWESESDLVGSLLIWMLQTGAVNLFNYMKAHPLAEVEKNATNLGLSPLEKLGYFLYIRLSSRLNDIEAAIEDDIANERLVLKESPRKRARQLRPRYEILVDDFLGMALGETKNYSKPQQLVVSAIRGTAVSLLAKSFRTNTDATGNRLENLNRGKTLNKLASVLENPAFAHFLGYGVKIAAETMAEGIHNKISHAPIETFPEVFTFLKETPAWDKHFAQLVQTVILNAILKRIEQRPTTTPLESTPFDALQEILEVVSGVFSRLSVEDVEKAKAIEDADERRRQLDIHFDPGAEKLYQLVEDEIPLPFPSITKSFFKDFFVRTIRTNAMEGFYDLWRTHHVMIEKATQDIESINAKSHAMETCKVIVAFIRDFIPHMLANDQVKLAKTLLETAKEQLIDFRIKAYIIANEENVEKQIEDYLDSQDASAEKADVLLFKNTHPDKVKELVIQHLKGLGGKDALDTFLPSDAEVDDYLTENKDLIKQTLEKNLIALGKSDSFSEAINLTLPGIEAIILGSMATVYKKVRDLADPTKHPEFSTKLLLRWLNTVYEYMQKINGARSYNGARAVHNLSHEETIEGFGETHPGVPATPEALIARAESLAAREKEKILLGKIHETKALKKKAKSEREEQLADAKLTLYRRERAVVLQQMEDADGILDAIRLEAFNKIAKEYLKFLGISSANDLEAMPKPIREFFHLFLLNGFMPKHCLDKYKKATTPHAKNLQLLKVLKSVRETEGDGPVYEKAVFTPPEDETQAELDEALGKVFKQFLSTLPKSVTYAALQIRGINKMTASALGGVIRQKLSKENLLMDSLESCLESIAPSMLEGSWTSDEEGKPIFTPASGSLAFTFPETIEELEEADFKLVEEEKAVEKRLKREFAQTISSQMKTLIKSRRNETLESILKKLIVLMKGHVRESAPRGVESYQKTHLGLWLDLQAILEDQIEEHLGVLGKTTKRVADKICNLFVLTICCGAIKMAAPPIYGAVFWVIEKYLERKAQQITKIFQLDILEDLYLRLIDDLLDMVNAPETENNDIGLLVKELEENTNEWVQQQEQLAQEEYENSNTAHVAALTREMQRIWNEEPSHTQAIKHIAREIRAKMNPANHSAGNEAFQRTSSSDSLTNQLGLPPENLSQPVVVA